LLSVLSSPFCFLWFLTAAGIAAVHACVAAMMWWLAILLWPARLYLALWCHAARCAASLLKRPVPARGLQARVLARVG
jgi:hypothetical protein